GEEDGSFDPGDLIRFYAQAINSPYTHENVYWLTFGTNNGLRMAVRNVNPAGGGTPAAPYRTTLHFEEDRIYKSSLPMTSGADHWYWTYTRYDIRGAVPTREIPIAVPAPAAGYDAVLRLQVRGNSIDHLVNPDHHLQVSINGQLLGDVYWDGYNTFEGEFAVPTTNLLDGDNRITIHAPGDLGVTPDIAYLNWFELDYYRRYLAQDNGLTFDGEEDGRHLFTITGFETADLLLYDITTPARPLRLNGIAIEPDGVGYRLRFSDDVIAERHYEAIAKTAVHTPVRIEADTPSNLKAPAQGADYIIISHADFLAQAQILADHRSGQGLRVALVDVQDVYDEFNGGIFSPLAIRDFLDFAYHYWPGPPPAYVVLLGDGHYDFKNNLDSGDQNFVPPYLEVVDPFIGETASDNRYVTVDGDDILPDIHIGRLPANTPAEAATMVNKIIGYERALPSGDWLYHTLWVADDPDAAGDFHALSDAVADHLLPAPYVAEKVYYGSPGYPNPVIARQAIVAAANNGVLLLNYVGHSSITNWAAELLFGLNELPYLANGNRLPFILSMTCYDGTFHSPGFPGLAETLIREANRGSVGSWSATGQGVATGHDKLHRGFYTAVFERDLRQIGPATLLGRLTLWEEDPRFEDLIDTFTVFGDPAMALATYKTDLHLEADVTPEVATLAQGDWVTYTFTYRNEDIAPARGVVLTATFSTPLSDVTVNTYETQALLRAGTPTGLYVWDIANVPSGEEGSVVVAGRIPYDITPADLPITVQAQISTSWSESDLTDNAVGPFKLELYPADVGVQLAVVPDHPVLPGDLITYTVSYGNHAQGVATDVMVTLLLPGGVENPQVTWQGPEPTLIPGTNLAWRVGMLEAGQAGIIRVVVRVRYDITASQAPLKASAKISTAWLDANDANDETPQQITSVLIPDLYEPDDSMVQAPQVSLPHLSANHTLHYYDDQDWVAFQGHTGVLYQIR
ncbi:MAG TPA: hypothetical protein EYH31_01755, partial [Anaerolineae bacterium]|nr:hypothetical protein [Anaerolineae bacterium]